MRTASANALSESRKGGAPYTILWVAIRGGRLAEWLTARLLFGPPRAALHISFKVNAGVSLGPDSRIGRVFD